MSTSAVSLRELQRSLAAEILRTGSIDPGVLRAPPRGTLASRLAAYVDGYPARIEEALRGTVPALAHLAGAAAFHALAHRFAERVPQSTFDLGRVAGSLADFLRGDELSERLPFAADLAELEWRIDRAFHAAVEPPLDPATLAAIPIDDWPRASLRFQAGTAVVRSPWPIADLWDARSTPIDEIDLALEDRPQSVLVHRTGYEVAVERLDEPEASAFSALLAGETLGAVATALAATALPPEAVAHLFTRCMRTRLITALSGT